MQGSYRQGPAETRGADDIWPSEDTETKLIPDNDAPQGGEAAWQLKERWAKRTLEKRALDRSVPCDDVFWSWAAPRQ